MATIRTPSEATLKKRASNKWIDAHSKWQKRKNALLVAQYDTKKALDVLNAAAVEAKKLGVPIEMPETDSA